MEWSAEALVLSVRKHGENGAIVDLLARDWGRYGGYVRGGNSRKMRPILQAGNMVQAVWRARVAEHLGTLTLEAGRAYAAAAMSDRAQLAGLSALCAMLQIIPERQAYPRLFDTALVVLDALAEDKWAAVYVRFELALLEEMGFGLELDACAATGAQADLTHISPRSGKAVSRDAAQPYEAQLFRLPPFLRDPSAEAEADMVLEGLRVMAHFLERRLYAPNGVRLPAARDRLASLIEKRLKTASTD